MPLPFAVLATLEIQSLFEISSSEEKAKNNLVSKKEY